MADIAQIGFAADTSGLDKAGNSLTNLIPAAKAAETAANKTADALANVGSAGNAVSKAIGGVGTQSSATQKVMAAATGAANDNTKAHQNLKNAVNASEKELGKLGEIFGVLESKALSLGANMGLVGEILQVIGPEGLIIAAALGAIVVAIDLLVTSANRMGELAKQLQNLSIVSGLTVTQLQVLQNVGVGLGLSVDQTSEAMLRFTEGLTDVRAGGGALYDQLMKVDPALVAQLSTTKDTATALNLLSKAYVNAGVNQNALAKAAFGRGGVQVGLLLNQVDKSGGMDGLAEGIEKVDLLTKQQTESWSKLSVQIEDASRDAKNNIASIYTSDVLQAELAFYNVLLDISRVAKEFTTSDDFKQYMAHIKSGASSGASIGNKVLPGVGGVAGGILGGGIGAVMGLFGAAIEAVTTKLDKMPDALDKFQGQDIQKIQSPANKYSTFQGGGGKTTLNSDGSEQGTGGSLGDQAARAAAMVSALGSAATATDKFDAASKALKVTLDAKKITDETYARALAGLVLDKQISQTTLYNGALGDLVTRQDILKASTQSLAKANQQGAGLTGPQIAAINNAKAAQFDQNRVNEQATAGIFSLQAAQNAASETLQMWIAKGIVNKDNTEQMAAAQLVLARNVKATGDAAQVAAAPLQGLKQLELDGKNLAKSLDSAATGALNNMVQPIQDMLNGVTSLSAGFKNLGVIVGQAIEQMIIKMLILTPIAQALQAAMGFMGFTGFAKGGLPGTPGSAQFGPVAPNALGGIYGNSSNLSSFSNSIVSSPTLFKFASGNGLMGEAGPEAIIPLMRGPNGSLGVQMYGQNSGSSNDNSPTIHYNPIYQIGGNVTQEDLARVKKAQDNDRKQFSNRTVSAIKEARKRNVRI